MIDRVTGIGATDCVRQRDNVLSLQQLVPEIIVRQLFEFFERHWRLSAHGLMILRLSEWVIREAVPIGKTCLRNSGDLAGPDESEGI